MKHVSELLPAVTKAKGICKSDVKLVDAAVVIQREPACTIAYLARELVQCTLPHRDPGDVARWSRTNGNLTLTLTSAVGYPYGSIPRLLLYWLTAEAVVCYARLKPGAAARKIQLGSSFYDFLTGLGFDSSRGGRCSDARRVKEQMRRLFAASISFSIDDPTGPEDRENMPVTDSSRLWWSPRNPEQIDLFESWVELGEKFFQAITARPVPLDIRALKALKRSPLALDLYAWVAHKVYSVKQKGGSQFVPWAGLHAQFGSDLRTVKDFRKKAMAALRKIGVVYPGLKLQFVPGGVVVLPDSRLRIGGNRRLAGLPHR